MFCPPKPILFAVFGSNSLVFEEENACHTLDYCAPFCMCLDDMYNVCCMLFLGVMEGWKVFVWGDNVSVRHDSPVCSVVFLAKQLCTQVRLLRIFWGEGSFDVGVRVRHVEGEGNALFPTSCPFFLVFCKCRC